MNNIQNLIRDLEMVMKDQNGHVHINKNRAKPLLEELNKLLKENNTYLKRLQKINELSS